MNYRHAYHAGNFADVVKHVILSRVLTYLKLKPQAFRVIDTHAGAGKYDLSGVESTKTGEWRDGIGRILGSTLPTFAAELLAPYLAAVWACNHSGALSIYPGSPLIARHLMRPTDQLIVNELHREDCALLRNEFAGTANSKVLNLDAWHAVRSLLPPVERRGVVLIDPPFESREEFNALESCLNDGLARFATGVFLIWYPVKDIAAADHFITAATGRPGLKYLDARVSISAPFPGLGLTEAGVLVLNPPFTLRAELQMLLPVLAESLTESHGGGYRLIGSDG